MATESIVEGSRHQSIAKSWPQAISRASRVASVLRLVMLTRLDLPAPEIS
jgi:hypothetical protein